MVMESIPALMGLTSDEKLILAAELWRENTSGAEDEPDPVVVSLLRERLARYRADPSAVSSWEEVKARLGR